MLKRVPQCINQALVRRLTMPELIEELSHLSDHERAELCDALLDRPELRELLDVLDTYLYLAKKSSPFYLDSKHLN
ncbi:MAG: hypothetical protein R2880_02360 [Deinococcales bacterium]